MSTLPEAPHPRVPEILATLDELQAFKDALESALDWLPIGYLLVDREGRVLKTNRAAQATIQQGTGLRVASGKLEAQDGADAATLRGAIRCAGDGNVQAAAACAGIVHLSRGLERPLAVILVQVHPPRHSVDPRVLVALLIPEGEAGRQGSGHLLRDLYGLTQREGDIAGDLLEGHHVNDIARQRELSVNTVRTHLKRLLEKTRTTRQADLLRGLLASFPPVANG
jgi:DNA-binding CsgD family transcriptional regulator